MKATKKTPEDFETNVQLSPDHLKRILKELNYGKESKTTRIAPELGGFGGYAPR